MNKRQNITHTNPEVYYRKEIFMNSIEDTIDGVKCVVNTCGYHAAGDRCSAAKIEILPRNASSSSETDCGTFKPSEMK